MREEPLREDDPGTGWRMKRSLASIIAACLLAIVPGCYTGTTVKPVGDPRPALLESTQVAVFMCYDKSDDECEAFIQRPFQVVADIHRVDDTRNFFTETLLPSSCNVGGQDINIYADIRFPETALRSALRTVTKTARSLGADGVIVDRIAVLHDKVEVDARAIRFEEQPTTAPAESSTAP